MVEKFEMARSLGVKGFGMWYMDAVDYPASKYPTTEAYWSVLAAAAEAPFNITETKTLPRSDNDTASF